LETIKLSVIITSFNAGKTISTCLHSLKDQNAHDEFEVIVVDSSGDDTGDIVEKEFPEVRLFRFSERKYCGDARNYGLSVARGNIVAFTDADCIVDRNWVKSILSAHRSPHLVIGGAIANSADQNASGWAAYFTEFSSWMPDTTAGRMVDVAGANMSYKRIVFENYGNFIEGTYCSDSDFHWRIAKDKHFPHFEPAILVYHNGISTFSKMIRHEYYHGCCFGRVRAWSKGWSKVKRELYASLFFFIFVKLFLKITVLNIKNHTYFPHFLRVIPQLLAGLYSWSIGECIGYMAGGYTLYTHTSQPSLSSSTGLQREKAGFLLEETSKGGNLS
jgi:glycosyltransferase involved in cell wall biosynthesis